MKIDKKNPNHLWALALSGVKSILVICARPITRLSKKEKVVVFYGHTLNGNLKPFFEFLSSQKGYKVYFLALEKQYYYKIRDEVNNPESVVYALSLAQMMKISAADVFVTSHGLHLFIVFKWLTNAIFVDVWHAVSFKGWQEDGFKLQRTYDAVWASSSAMREMYIKRYKTDPKKTKTTGYGRTDQLVDGSLNRNEILSKYAIPKSKKYVLIAPTWAQDVKGRPLLPFGMDPKLFFTALDQLAARLDAHIIFRTHLNSGDAIKVPNLRHTSFMPYSKYEVVEEFLFIADVLVSDWSSVSIDYLPLKRPTIFLDVPAPYKDPFNIDPKYRYGDIVGSINELLQSLEANLKHPEKFKRKYNKIMEEATDIAYGDTLDGKSISRYFKNLQQLLK